MEASRRDPISLSFVIIGLGVFTYCGGDKTLVHGVADLLILNDFYFTHRTGRGRRMNFGSQSKLKQNMVVWCQENQKMQKRKKSAGGPILLYNLHWVTGTFSWIPLPWKHFLKFVSEGPPREFFLFCIFWLSWHQTTIFCWNFDWDPKFILRPLPVRCVRVEHALIRFKKVWSWFKYWGHGPIRNARTGKYSI